MGGKLSVRGRDKAGQRWDEAEAVARKADARGGVLVDKLGPLLDTRLREMRAASEGERRVMAHFAQLAAHHRHLLDGLQAHKRRAHKLVGDAMASERALRCVLRSLVHHHYHGHEGGLGAGIAHPLWPDDHFHAARSVVAFVPAMQPKCHVNIKREGHITLRPVASRPVAPLDAHHVDLRPVALPNGDVLVVGSRQWSSPLRECRRLDVAANTWHALPTPAPSTANLCGVCVVGTTVVVVGCGVGVLGDGGGALVIGWDTKSGQWTRITEPPVVPTGCAVVAAGTRVLLVGDDGSEGVDGQVVLAVDLCGDWWAAAQHNKHPSEPQGQQEQPGSPQGDEPVAELPWLPLSPMLFRRRVPAAAGTCDRVFAFGGWSPQGALASCEALHVERNAWEPLPPMPFKRAFATACLCGNLAFVVGGYDGLRTQSTVLSFDIGASVWCELVLALSRRRETCGVTCVGTTLLVLGGWDGGCNADVGEMFRF